MRVVVDTNVFVSRFLSLTGVPAVIMQRWRQGAFTLLVSEELLAEYAKALSYPRIYARHGMAQHEIAEAVDEVRQFALLLNIRAIPPVVLADPDDDVFIACAVAGGADYIVSGDKHLLALGQYAGISIVNPRTFLDQIRKSQGT
ncbi:MAG: putative toxin-antitoxin system toxin component, PIN family [Chloroflexota bacterium]|nr:putative toxin-antitoxin system toxin component, PIN family [Chloroflexota bacterium]